MTPVGVITTVVYAVPVMLLLLVLEALSYRFLPDDDERGYEVRDTATSLSMGLGSQVIVWDRLLGTFQAEGDEQVVYGLTKDIHTFNPLRVAFHEFTAAWRDARSAETWRDRIGLLFGPPGWTPAAALERVED